MQISDLLTGMAVVIIALAMFIFAATVHIWAEPKSKENKSKENKSKDEEKNK